MRSRWSMLASLTGSSLPGCSSRTLMNEQPSKPGARNHPSNTSKIASSRWTGSSVRASTSARSQPTVHCCSRSSRNAITRSCFEPKCR